MMRPMPLRPRHCFIAALAVCAVCLPRWAAAQQFENEINASRSIAEDARNMFRDLDGAVGAQAELFAPDLPEAKKWFEDLAARYDNVAVLFGEGKEPAARAAWGEADALRAGQYRWRERLERRVRQQELAPSEAWLNDNRRWLFQGGEPLLMAWAEARKAASEAWGRCAGITTPARPEADVRAALDAAAAATFESQTAEWKLSFHREFHEVMSNREITPEVAAKLKALEQTVADQVENARQRDAMERRTRDLNDQRRVQQDELRKVFGAAMQAKREADEAKRRAEEQARQKAQQK